MFGWIYVLLGVSGKIGGSIKGLFHDAKESEKAKNTFNRTYFDNKGKDRYVKNGRWVHITVINGDRVLEDVENKQIYLNYSEEIRNKNRTEARKVAIKNGNRAYLYKTKRERIEKKDNIPFSGDLYQDVYNNNIYAVLNRYVNNTTKDGIVELYIDIKTGLFIGKSDTQICVYDKKWKEKYDTYVDDAMSCVETMSELNGWAYDKTEYEIEKFIVKRRKYILSHYIPDDKMNDYLKEINSLQKGYYSNNNELAYYSFRRKG